MSICDVDDRTRSVALQLARDYLQSQGWKYGPADIGKTAKEILDSLGPGRIIINDN